MSQETCLMASPVGWLAISGSLQGVRSIRFLDVAPDDAGGPVPACLQACVQQLTEYFRGDRQRFDLLLDSGGTPFERRVWAAVSAIPFGVTRSYLAVARELGDENTVRAVGRANGQNPLPIVVPCHRVIGSNGSLTGYAGGLWRKEWLLRHEGHPVQPRLF